MIIGSNSHVVLLLSKRPGVQPPPPVVDVTAPTLSSPLDAANGHSASTASVVTNEANGTLYWVVSTSSTAPSAAQVKAGETHTSASATASGSQAVTMTGTQAMAPSGLAPSTAYFTHFMHEDAAGNPSTVATASGFTTAAEPIIVTDALPRAWDPTTNSGTTADIYVDATRPDDSGAGTSLGTAKKTVQAGLNAAKALGGLRVVHVVGSGVKYRETPVPNGFQGILRGHSTHKPIITGHEVLTGWTQCGTGDAAALGNVLGVAGSDIWKKTINTADIADRFGLNVYEGDTPIPVCQARDPAVADLFHLGFDREFIIADSFSNPISSIRDDDVLSGAVAGVTLTSAQLVGRAWVYLWHSGNQTAREDITSYSSGTTIGVTGNKSQEGSTGTPDRYRWNLCNCLPYLKRGTHGVIDNGNGTTTIYIWPLNTTSLSDGSIEYAKRSNVFGSTGEAVSNLTLENIQLLGGKTVIYWNALASAKSNITIRNCRMGKVTNAGGDRTIFIRPVNDLVVERCTVFNIAVGFGMSIEGGSWPAGTPCNRITVQQNEFTNISKAACRTYHGRDVKYVFNTVHYTGRGGHANALNFYLGCNRVLVFGNKYYNQVGYVTIQHTSNVFMGMNFVQASITDQFGGRAIEDQTNQQTKPEYGETNYVWNNQIVPYSQQLGRTNTVQLGKPWYPVGLPDSQHPSNTRWSYLNNIVHGGGIVEPYRNWASSFPPGVQGTNWDYWENRPGPPNGGPNWSERDRRGNLYTAQHASLTSGNGFTLDPTEMETNTATAYVGAGVANFRAPPSSPILTRSGVSIAGVIAAAQAALTGSNFADFNFAVDCDGFQIDDVTTLRVGPFHSDYNTQIAALMPA